MGILLIELERCVAYLRPTPWVVAVTMRSTNFVNPMNRLIWHFDHHVEEFHFVENAERSALLRGSIIRQENNHCVIFHP